MSYSDTRLVALFALQQGFAAALSWPCSSLQICVHNGFGAQFAEAALVEKPALKGNPALKGKLVEKLVKLETVS